MPLWESGYYQDEKGSALFLRSSKSDPLWGVHSISLTIFLLEVAKPAWSLVSATVDGGGERGLCHPGPCPGPQTCWFPFGFQVLMHPGLPLAFRVPHIPLHPLWSPLASSGFTSTSQLLCFARSKWGLIWRAGQCWCFAFCCVLPSQAAYLDPPWRVSLGRSSGAFRRPKSRS